MLPALQAAGTQPKQMMAESARGVTGGRVGERIRSALVITEVALAFVLLVGTTLLATSFLRLWNVERGFATAGLLSMSVPPHPTMTPTSAAQPVLRVDHVVVADHIGHDDEIPGRVERLARSEQLPANTLDENCAPVPVVPWVISTAMVART